MHILQKQLTPKERKEKQMQQRAIRKHRHSHQPAPLNNCQLPAISKIILTFPIKKIPKTTAVHYVEAKSKKMEAQLQKLFVKNSIKLSEDYGNKRIFNGPSKSRITLNNSFIINWDLEQKANPTNYRSHSIKQHKQLNSRAIKLNSYNIEVNESLNAPINLDIPIPSTEDSSKPAEQVKEQLSITMRPVTPRARKSLRFTVKESRCLGWSSLRERYSPWGRQNEEELLV